MATSNRTIAGVSALSTLIALGIILLLAVLLVLENLSSYRGAGQDQRTVELISALDGVAHQHAVERGLTAGYLGNPNPAALDKVRAQRDKADAAELRFKQVLSQIGLSALSGYSRQVVEQLRGKAALRAEVDNRNGKHAFAYYSQLNRLALDAMVAVGRELNNQNISTELNAAILLAQFKERAGQLRGRMNGVLAAKSLSDGARADVQYYQNELATLQQYLSDQLEEVARRQVDGVLSDEVSDEIQRVVNDVLGGADFADLPVPAVWFPLASKQIGNVKQLLDAQWVSIIDAAHSAEKRALLLLIVSVAAIVIAVVTLLVLNAWLSNLIKKELPVLVAQLETVANNHDMSVRLNASGKHELARIARAVQSVIDKSRESIESMIKAVETSTIVNRELDDACASLMKNSDYTQRTATSIAAAIEENSSASHEIASSASSTMDNTRQIAEHTRTSLKTTQQASAVLNELGQNSSKINVQSQQLTENVNEITETVRRINELFEQTNLLALNASIEAARAGEHGRGFAVVADEVRTLAIRSIEASEQIVSVLKKLRANTDSVNASVSENNTLSDRALAATRENELVMQDIASTLAELETMSTSVAAATEEQYSVSQTIARDATEVLTAADGNLDTSRQIEGLIRRLDSVEAELSANASKFRL